MSPMFVVLLDFSLLERTLCDLLICQIVTVDPEHRTLFLAPALIRFSLSTEGIKSVMLIPYLLLACTPSFVISLMLLIWCNVMKLLEAALGASLASGTVATSRPALKPTRLSKRRERRRPRVPGVIRLSSHKQRGRGISVSVEGGTTLWDRSILPNSLPTEDFPSNACVITPRSALPQSWTKAPTTPDICRLDAIRGPLQW